MKAALVLGGRPPDPALLARETASADLVIGVDRGVSHVLRQGIIPDLAVGDMDSLPAPELAALRERGVPVEMHPAHKDETDGQLAVDLALREGARELVLLAADGGRPDHEFANYLILRRAAQAGARARIAAAWGEAIVTGGREEFTGWPGRVVSILPLCESLDVGPTGGLAYDVGRPALTLDHTRGVSNLMTGERAFVTIERGWALIFLINDAV
jgi:thiamine pyrophosphokinase